MIWFFLSYLNRDGLADKYPGGICYKNYPIKVTHFIPLAKLIQAVIQANPDCDPSQSRVIQADPD